MKLGSACASHFSFEGPSIASVAFDPKIAARLRGGRVSELSSLAGGPFLIAKFDTDSNFRVAPSGIWAFLPVDNVDNVDKWAESSVGRPDGPELQFGL
jgi:hypothetical protein